MLRTLELNIYWTNGPASSWKNVTSGVPQGSVLGPVLFLIYINDLDDGISNWILKFADDTKIFGKINDSQDAENLQKDVDRLIQWSNEWQMMFNIRECKVMHIGKGQFQASYSMNNIILDKVNQEKDLGVVIDSNLKVSSQCIPAYGKAYQILEMSNRTIQFKTIIRFIYDVLHINIYLHFTFTFTKDIMLNLYKALVRPLLEYCMLHGRPTI